MSNFKIHIALATCLVAVATITQLDLEVAPADDTVANMNKAFDLLLGQSPDQSSILTAPYGQTVAGSQKQRVRTLEAVQELLLTWKSTSMRQGALIQPAAIRADLARGPSVAVLATFNSLLRQRSDALSIAGLPSDQPTRLDQPLLVAMTEMKWSQRESLLTALLGAQHQMATRSLALSLLAKHGTSSSAAAVAALLVSTDAEFASAPDVLVTIGARGRQDVRDAIAPYLVHQSSSVRARAWSALRDSGLSTDARLMAAARAETDPTVLVAMVVSRTGLRAPSDTEAVVAQLDRQDEVAIAAMKVLGASKDLSHFSQLRQLAEQGSSDELKGAAILALESLTGTRHGTDWVRWDSWWRITGASIAAKRHQLPRSNVATANCEGSRIAQCDNQALVAILSNSESDPATQKTAARLLVSRGAVDCIPQLAQILDDAPVSARAKLAHRVLTSVCGRELGDSAGTWSAFAAFTSSSGDEKIKLIQAAIENAVEAPSSARLAIEIATENKVTEALSQVNDLLARGDATPEIRKIALEALPTLADRSSDSAESRRSVQILIEALEDSDASISDRAIASLRQLTAERLGGDASEWTSWLAGR